MAAMGFEDLPANWNDVPLTEPAFVADVLDLCVMQRDRHRGALVLLICDDDARLVQPVVVEDLPERLDDDERARPFEVAVEAMGGVGSLLVAIARRDGLTISDNDRDWAAAAVRVCGDRVRLLGVHVVTTFGSRPVQLPRAA
jgi:hypothetical protein